MPLDRLAGPHKTAPQRPEPGFRAVHGTADLALVVRPRDRGTYDGACLVHPRDDAYRAVLPRGHRLAGKQAPIESLLPGATGHRR